MPKKILSNYDGPHRYMKSLQPPPGRLFTAMSTLPVIRYLIVMLFCLPTVAFAQRPDTPSAGLKNRITATANAFTAASLELAAISRDWNAGKVDKYVFNKKLEEKFTYLSFDRSALPATNSAAVDISDNDTKLKLTFSRKHTDAAGAIKSLFSIGSKLNLNDGIGELFKGRTASTGTTLFLNYSALGKVKMRTVKTVFINGEEKETAFGAFLAKLAKLDEAFNNKYGNTYELKYSTLVDRLAAIQQELAAGKKPECCTQLENKITEKTELINNLKGQTSKTDSNNALQMQLLEMELTLLENDLCKCRDKGKQYIAALFTEKAAIEKDLQEAGFDDAEPDKLVAQAVAQHNKKRLELFEDAAPWDWYKLRWFSGGITYRRDAYTTYDNALELEKKFDSKDYNAWGVSFSYNWFQERSQQAGFLSTWYASIGYDGSTHNNYDDLDDQDISKTTSTAYPGNVTINFLVNKKAKDITGVDYRTSWKHAVNLSGTGWFKGKTLGLNLLFQPAFSAISQPVFDAKAGVLFALTNSDYDEEDKNSKAKVNFEIFIGLPDMSDTRETGKSVWQNRVIGISTSVPFGKLFL